MRVKAFPKGKIVKNIYNQNLISYSCGIEYEGGVRICGDAVSLHFWCGFSFFFCILFCGIVVSIDHVVYGYWIILARF